MILVFGHLDGVCMERKTSMITVSQVCLYVWLRTETVLIFLHICCICCFCTGFLSCFVYHSLSHFCFICFWLDPCLITSLRFNFIFIMKHYFMYWHESEQSNLFCLFCAGQLSATFIISLFYYLTVRYKTLRSFFFQI